MVSSSSEKNRLTHEATPRHAQERMPRRSGYAARFAVGGLAVSLFCGVAHNGPALIDNISAATSYTDENNEVSDIASKIADMPIRVDCNDKSIDTIQSETIHNKKYQILGYVEPLHIMEHNIVSLPVVTLRNELCTSITNFDPKTLEVANDTRENANPIDDAVVYAEAVAILMHEEEHVKQTFNEAAATCYAVQKLPKALGELGMEETVAREVSYQAASDLGATAPQNYTSEECRPNGKLDLHISDVYVHKAQ